MRKKRRGNVEWINAPDITKRILHLNKALNLNWIESSKIHCFRSKNSKSRAYARIWGLPKVWQKALETEPAYVIEVLTEKFDSLPKKEQDKVLLHELAHIPKNFSGSLLPHIRKKGKRNFHDRVRKLVRLYNKKVI